MPPSQWLKLRQSKSPRGSASTLDKIDAPVVVKPETISNKASTKLGMARLNQKGSAPTRLITIQERPVATNPSWA